jgi:hypothetical protein
MEQYIPIAIHDFGIDQDTGLQKQLWVWQITIDKKSNKIAVIYDIILIAPTGIALMILKTGSYIRDNDTDSQHFATMQAGPLGQGITISITEDLDKIQSFETLEQDLQES